MPASACNARCSLCTACYLRCAVCCSPHLLPRRAQLLLPQLSASAAPHALASIERLKTRHNADWRATFHLVAVERMWRRSVRLDETASTDCDGEQRMATANGERRTVNGGHDEQRRFSTCSSHSTVPSCLPPRRPLPRIACCSSDNFVHFSFFFFHCLIRSSVIPRAAPPSHADLRCHLVPRARTSSHSATHSQSHLPQRDEQSRRHICAAARHARGIHRRGSHGQCHRKGNWFVHALHSVAGRRE